MSRLITADEAAHTARACATVGAAAIADEYIGHLRAQLDLSATKLAEATAAGDRHHIDIWTGALCHDRSLVVAAEQAWREASR